MMRCRLCGSTTDNPVAGKHWREEGICPGWWERIPNPTPWWVGPMLAFGIIGGVVALLFAVFPDGANAPTTPSPTASPTAIAPTTPSPTHTKEPGSPSMTPTSPSIEAFAPTKVLVSEIATPSPVNLVVQGGAVAYLQVPPGTTVVWGGCASDGKCYSFNFYWASTHESVLQYGEGPVKVQHELCHAHQHWSINGGAAIAPSDYDLESWYGTAEGQSFTTAIAGLPWPWSHSAVNALEDFAWTCAYYYLDAAYLQQASPERYAWARTNLP